MKTALLTRLLVICINLLLLAACGPAPAITPVAAVPTAPVTAAASPTRTPTATWVPTATETATTTFTATATNTPTATAGPTRTPKPSQSLWRGDLHIHTDCSENATSSYEEVVQRALDLDFDFIAITNYAALYVEQCSEAIQSCRAETRLVCIPGSELAAINEGGVLLHFVALGLEQGVDFMLPIKAQVEEIHRQGGLAIAAHPYSAAARYTEDELLHSGLDAMECARGTPDENQRQWELSEKYGLPCVYVSDAHQVSEMGQMYTVCSVPIHSLADLKAALVGKKCGME